MTTDRREALVEDIVQAELAMFLAVRNRGGRFTLSGVAGNVPHHA